MSARAGFVVALLLFAGRAAAENQPAAVSILLDDSVVFVTAVPAPTKPPGQTQEPSPPISSGELVVLVKGSDAKPTVTFTRAPGTARVDTVSPSPWRGDRGRDHGVPWTRWHFQVKVVDLPPNALQKHAVSVTVGTAKTHELPFWVTNRTVRGPQFGDPGKPWIVRGWLPVGGGESRCTSILVTPGDIPAAGLVLLQASVVRDSPPATIGLESFRLCKDFGCQGVQPVWVPAGRASTLWICLDEGFGGHGKFTGTLTLGASHLAEGKPVSVELQKSDLLVRFLGILVIAFGVWLGWWVRVVAKSRLNRYQALAPALALHQRVTALRLRVEAVPQTLQTAVAAVLERLEDLEKELAEDNLEANGLPSATILPWRQAGLDTASTYKAFLDAKVAEYSALEALVTEGVEAVVSRNKSDAAKVTALHALGDIASTLPARDVVRERIRPILATLDGEQAEATAEATDRGLTYRDVLLQIEKLSRQVWWVWGVLTVIAGVATMILDNAGFGTPLHFVLALFWGMGVPAVLNQLTPDTVTSKVGVSIPT